ncbi:integrase core domain-containing protein [Rathayibacter iranicus]|uniref:integrase core domain-containing protein n=1 Tax=Rathayibacter iranicus TaxID=59737 RepID=UPI001401D341|nr:integrase core domain-containing protein [Rathayibacter iranicus]
MNRSGYGEWRVRKTSRTAKWRTEIISLIQAASDGTYGYRRIAAQLARWADPRPTTPSAGSCAPQAGYALADRMRTELVTEALDMAARTQPDRLNDTSFHNDRESVDTSAKFGQVAKKLNIRQSMGRTGVCWDNAWAESFNGTLKNERCNRPTIQRKRKRSATRHDTLSCATINNDFTRLPNEAE